MKSLLIAVLTVLIVTTAFCRDVSLTIYNNNLALVHEVRELHLKKGDMVYDFTEIPYQIDPTSVHFRAKGISILEQNYEYDIVSVDKIREKFVGEKIRVYLEDGDMLEGILQPGRGGELILLDEAQGVMVVSMGKIMRVEFPSMPENFVQRPTLVWLLNSNSGGKQKAEISYLTGGMNWHAEYIAVVEEKKLGFAGWVSLVNESGETFEDAKLKLMAGEVHMVQEGRYRYGKGAEGFALAAGADQFEEKAFFEYHLYTLQRPTTVKNNQIKQVSLFPEAQVKYHKGFIYEAALGDNKVRVYLEFKNSKSDGLGMALPAGKVRVYQQDEDGSLEFIGEDMIKHTPRDEDVKLLIGNAFDLVGERQVVERRQISRFDREEDIEISLRNHKDEEVEIVVRERLWGYWSIINNTHEYVKKDANTIEFTVKVPPHKANEELLIKYTVRYSNR